MKRRYIVLQQLCNSQGISYEMREEKKYLDGFDKTSIMLYSTFQVPISILESTRQFDAKKVKTYLKTAASNLFTNIDNLCLGK